jgi:hypothetical protein
VIWTVVAEAPDGRVTRTRRKEWQNAVELVREFRLKGYHAWIEDVAGKRVDESTGR